MVRIVHGKDPEAIEDFDQLAKLYGEAEWFIQMQQRQLAEEFIKLLNRLHA